MNLRHISEVDVGTSWYNHPAVGARDILSMALVNNSLVSNPNTWRQMIERSNLLTPFDGCIGNTYVVELLLNSRPNQFCLVAINVVI